MMSKTIGIFFVLILMELSASEEISDSCLGCICHASSGCNKNQGCTDGGVCGPFLITWPFWADAGKYVISGTSPENPNAYADCTKDLFCASETVRAYARKYSKDCNGDGVIDCEDFARIHRNGPAACADPNILNTEFYKTFSQCKAFIRPQPQ